MQVAGWLVKIKRCIIMSEAEQRGGEILKYLWYSSRYTGYNISFTSQWFYVARISQRRGTRWAAKGERKLNAKEWNFNLDYNARYVSWVVRASLNVSARVTKSSIYFCEKYRVTRYASDVILFYICAYSLALHLPAYQYPLFCNYYLKFEYSFII